MKRKGFTLIELLAVIIVLAIIALIATPIIFNVIENAKIKSLENSCYGVIDAVRTKYAEGLLNSENGLVDLTGDVADLTIAGEHPYMGTWEIDNSKDSAERGIKIQGVKFQSMKNYTCSNVDENGAITSKVSCEKDGPDEVQPTITAKQATVEVNKGTDKRIKDYFTVKFGKTGGQATCEVANVSELDVGDHTVKCTATGTNGKTAEATVKITVKEVASGEYTDNSKANKPVLFNNMKPIKYENNKWLVANTSEKWYDYDAKEWANAVVLNSGVTKNVGDEVTEEDVALWYVWIPRYKYTIFNGNNESVAAQLINVTFESGVSRTGTVTCSDNADGSETCSTITNGTSTYTHPAFKFGNTELTGFWVGKFEISTTDSTCNSSASSANCNKVLTMTIKPNVSSWRYATISNHFTSIQNAKTTYGINNADSHMMKNMEWGAVAYLKQSKYGLGTTDIAVNTNSSYYTGGGTSDAYKTNVAQSTTGNIYGVYDMSGGAWERVMGNMKNSSNAFYSSNAGFTTAPDAKYYDSYKYDSSSNKTHARGKLGDATKETLATFGNTSGGWYSDYAYFPNSSYPWFNRGGGYGVGTGAGVFNFTYGYGGGYDDNSARAVLTAE